MANDITPTVDYTVRALWKQRGAPDKWPHYVTSCESRMRALHIAKNVREIFDCSTWIESFDQPASLPLLRVREAIERRTLTGRWSTAD